ncbi:hypothetical protein NLG97_g7798 [Lecanicillium saksenae]|uniref:Uncharacterized protein n=1 Tax=Lecanicillium saksenae TaxID=468837 RepID=A0ACC1QKS4_9HYPO|nr:hypothetical protein NLG97_g7798 [Lecanicillium saksenae]
MPAMGSKKRKLAQVAAEVTDGAPAAGKNAQKAFFKNASNWNLEQDYESRPRKGKKKEPKESNKLPIKTADGRLEILNGLDEDGDDVSVESDDDWLEGREDEEEWEPEADDEEEPAPTIPESQQIIEAQEEMANLAMALNENPEENVASLKTLAKYGESEITAIQMLALMTQMAVYKDIIPGYRIRPLTEEEQKEKISKDIRQLRQFEQSLVAGYQSYLKELNRIARLGVRSKPGTQSISNVAYTCACTLLTAVPHFNFRSELLKILVWKLSKRRIDDDGSKCLQALETLFREDEEGRPTMEAVSLLTKMMKSREYQVDQVVLNLFLALRLLSEFRGTASRDRVDKEGEDGEDAQQPPQKMKKAKREFRTKRERKMMKEQKSIAKEMTQADALVSHEERERMQSETLKMVFACYFRILKLREPHLMGAVLEGLAKYARLINQDFFGDLLEALKDLIRHSIEDANAESSEENGEEVQNNDEDEEGDGTESSRNLTREALLCTVTAHTLLAGQDAHNSRNALHLDLSYFTTHLYRSLLDLSTNPDLELTKPPSSTFAAGRFSRINVQTTTVLLLRSLTAILLPPWNIRSVPPLRLAAFTKQLMTSSLQLPEKSCQGTLALLGDVAHTHGKKVRSLWNTEERKGDGRFNPVSDSVEGSNPFATTVWEGELLRKHYSPKVREGHQLLVKSMNSK